MPSCASTIPPGSSPGSTAGASRSARSPRQSCESSVQPASLRPRSAASARVNSARSPTAPATAPARRRLTQRRQRRFEVRGSTCARGTRDAADARTRAPPQHARRRSPPRAAPGHATTRSPSTKNVARTPAAASAASTAGVPRGSGPSSNVSASTASVLPASVACIHAGDERTGRHVWRPRRRHDRRGDRHRAVRGGGGGAGRRALAARPGPFGRARRPLRIRAGRSRQPSGHRRFRHRPDLRAPG